MEFHFSWFSYRRPRTGYYCSISMHSVIIRDALCFYIQRGRFFSVNSAVNTPGYSHSRRPSAPSANSRRLATKSAMSYFSYIASFPEPGLIGNWLRASPAQGYCAATDEQTHRHTSVLGKAKQCKPPQVVIRHHSHLRTRHTQPIRKEDILKPIHNPQNKRGKNKRRPLLACSYGTETLSLNMLRYIRNALDNNRNLQSEPSDFYSPGSSSGSSVGRQVDWVLVGVQRVAWVRCPVHDTPPCLMPSFTSVCKHRRLNSACDGTFRAPGRPVIDQIADLS